MRGTEKIIAHIQADADAKAAEIIASANKKAAEITEEYKEKARDIYTKSVNSSQLESEAHIESMSRMSQMEGKKKSLAIKQEMVSNAFDRAKEIIKQLPDKEYVAFLVKLAVEGSTTGKEELIFNPADAKAVGKKVIEKANKEGNLALTLSKETREFEGGLILKRGNIEVNCTIELLIEARREEMSAEVVNVLFG